MSLKVFHLVFITCAALLALGTGYWAVTTPDGAGRLVLAVCCFLVLVLLIPYGVWFRRKMWKGGAS